jgi:hypothetical protein
MNTSFPQRFWASLIGAPRPGSSPDPAPEATTSVHEPALEWMPWIEPALPDWFWTLPAATLLAVLDVDGARFAASDSIHDFHWAQLREMALRLVVDCPAGSPYSTADFLSRFDPVKLSRLWGGVFDSTVPWMGMSGIDRMIAAVVGGPRSVLPCVHAEVLNQLRHWAEFPEQLRSAVLTAEPTLSLSLPPETEI